MPLTTDQRGTEAACALLAPGSGVAEDEAVCAACARLRDGSCRGPHSDVPLQVVLAVLLLGLILIGATVAS